MEERPFSDISYERYLKDEKLMGSRCARCRALYVPPRPICIKCQGDSLTWEEMSGSGKLSAFTCISIGPSFMIAEGYNRKNPYCSGVVELDEGPRVDARIDGVDPKNPDAIIIGMPLRIKFVHGQKEELPITYMAFEPVSG